MARAKKIYRRIGSGGFSAFDYVRLYQGPDHLLEVHSAGYAESYRRFFFTDIQSFAIEKTIWGRMGTIVLSFVGGFFLLVVLVSGGGVLAGSIIGGFFGLFLLANTLLGPTCAMYVQTAVQRQRLRAVMRVRTAHRLLNRAASEVRAAQGGSTEEEILSLLRQARQRPLTHATPMDAPPVISA